METSLFNRASDELVYAHLMEGEKNTLFGVLSIGVQIVCLYFGLTCIVFFITCAPAVDNWFCGNHDPLSSGPICSLLGNLNSLGPGPI